MSCLDDPKFRRPSDAVGDWHFVRNACFEHEAAPTAMKFIVEKMTRQLLQRERRSVNRPDLRYVGTSGAGGYPTTVRLELFAIGGGRHLYRLTHEVSAPCRWEDESHFIADCERRFLHWRRQLHIVDSEVTWPAEPLAALSSYVSAVAAAEDAAARIIEDLAPVTALQRQVVDSLRAGMGFFSSSKEGVTRLFFDGCDYRREDRGDGPDASAIYANEACMLAAVRRFYDWDATQDSYPHPKSEREVWQYIHDQLRQIDTRAGGAG